MYHGWLNIYKPRFVSSAKVVSIVKKALKNTKVGHCGTLDVEAEGILPIALGDATKLVRLLVDAQKTYIFTVQFGNSTDTADASGKVIKTTDQYPNFKQCYDVCSKFIGNIKQIPPKFSALKVNGRRAYDMARSNIDFELKSREITIYDLKCLYVDEMLHTAKYLAVCSKGTYIRTLAEDISLCLQSLGFVVELQRIQVGMFKSEDAIHICSKFLVDDAYRGQKLKFHESKDTKVLDSFEVSDFSSSTVKFNKEYDEFVDDLRLLLADRILSLETILDDIPVVDVTNDVAVRIRHGIKVHMESVYNYDFCWIRCLNKLVAIGQVNNCYFTSFRVFNH